MTKKSQETSRGVYSFNKYSTMVTHHLFSRRELSNTQIHYNGIVLQKTAKQITNVLKCI